MVEIKYIILHCTATRENVDYSIEQLRADHKKRGFKAVGYHYYVRKDGYVYQERELTEPGAHCKGYNSCSIGIAYEGGLDKNGKPANTLTEAQEKVIRTLIRSILKLHPKAKVMGHCDFPHVYKSCPCLNAREIFGNEDIYDIGDKALIWQV